MQNGVPELPLLTLRQAAPLLCQSVRTLRAWINSGKITYVQIGKQYRIKRSTINALIEQKTVEASKNAALHPSRRKKPVRKQPPPNEAQEDVG